MKNEYTYYQPPLCLLQETFNNPTEGLNIISSFAIVNYAMKYEININDVAKQLMYAYYRKADNIQSRLHSKLRNYIDEGEIILDEDYNGFNGSEFNPEREIESILKLFTTDKDFKNSAILCWQINKAADSLKVNLGSIDTTLNKYNKGLSVKNKFESEYGADVWPSIKPTQLFEFRDSGKDIDLFRAYIAIKSLIGQHNYVATTRNVILMRMLGCKSNQVLNDFLKANKQAREIYNRYTRSDKALRYHFDKLFQSLLERGFLMSKIFERTVSRKIFISQKLNYDQLANEIIKFHNKRKHKKDEQQAIQRIRATI